MKSKLIIITSIFFVIFFISLPLSSAERYKQIEVELNFNNSIDGNQINVANRTSQQYSNYNLTWKHFNEPLSNATFSRWELDEYVNSTTVEDSIGDTDGYVEGDVHLGKEGKFDTCAFFPSNTDRIKVPNTENYTSNDTFSVSLWFKLKRRTTSNVEFFSEATAGFFLRDNIQLSLEYVAGNDYRLEFRIREYPGTSHAIAETNTITVMPGEWHNVIGTAKEGEDVRIFYDGDEEPYNTQETLTDDLQTGSNWVIGVSSSGTYIDDVSIISEYITENQAENIAKAPHGSVSCAMLPPSQVTIEATAGSTQSVVQYASFSPNEIMEGSSIHWWRAPFNRIGPSVSVNLEIYRTTSLRSANVSYSSSTDASGWYNTNVSWVSDPYKVFEETYSVSETTDKYKYHVDQVNWENHTWNFTYLRAFAPIYSGFNYVIIWQWQDDWSTSNYETDVYVTQSDVGDDDYYFSIWHLNGTSHYPKIDLLTDVLFEYGLRDRIAGTDLGGIDNPVGWAKFYTEFEDTLYNRSATHSDNNESVAFTAFDTWYKVLGNDTIRKDYNFIMWNQTEGDGVTFTEGDDYDIDYNVGAIKIYDVPNGPELSTYYDVEYYYGGCNAFNFIIPFTTNESGTEISLRITMYDDDGSDYGMNIFTHNNQTEFMMESGMSYEFGLDGEWDNATYAFIFISFTNDTNLWLIDRHDYDIDYNFTSSTLLHKYSVYEDNNGFVPYHTVDIIDYLIENTIPFSFEQSAPLMPLRPKGESQKTLLELIWDTGSMILKVTKFIVTYPAHLLADLVKDYWNGANVYAKDKLDGFVEWASDGLEWLKDRGAWILGKIWDVVKWLVNFTVWQMYTMLRLFLNIFSFVVFLAMVAITFKFTNYFIILGTSSIQEANDYLTNEVQSGIQRVSSLTMAVASGGSTMAGKIGSGVSKVRSKYKEWRNR